MEFSLILLATQHTGSNLAVSEDVPSVLMPVGNRPLISYQFEFLQTVGFGDAIVIIEKKHATAMEEYLKLYHAQPKHINIRVEVVPDNATEVEALLHVKDSIKRDVIVTRGDCILSTKFLQHMLDVHRSENSKLTILVRERQPDPTGKPFKISRKTPANLLGVGKGNQLLYLQEYSAKEDEEFAIEKKLLKSFPRMTLYSNFVDAHFYIFSNWVFSVLAKHKTSSKLKTRKTDVIPLMLRCQYEKTLTEGLDAGTVHYQFSEGTAQDPVKCMMYDMGKDQYSVRVSSIPSYLTINREIASGAKEYKPREPVGKKNFIAASANINEKTVVGSDCVVGADTVIGGRCGIKKSCIGNGCNIGDNVKIINSVIMNNVTIEEKCKIQNSVIVSNTFIKANSQVTERVAK